MQQNMEMLQDLSITGIDVMCAVCVICLCLMLFAFLIVILVNTFSLPFFLLTRLCLCYASACFTY